MVGAVCPRCKRHDLVTPYDAEDTQPWWYCERCDLEFPDEMRVND